MNNDKGTWLTFKEYSLKYGIPHRTIYDMVKDGRLRCTENGWPRMVLDTGKKPVKTGRQHKWIFR